MNIEFQDISKTKPFAQRVEKKFNNYIWMLAFVIASVCILFLALTLTYLFSKNWSSEAVQLSIPPIFYVDTFILLMGSVSLIMASKAFKNDNSNLYKIWLYSSLLFGVSFLMGQLGGWFALAQSGFGLTESRSGAFLYVISGLHALHIIGGIIFLAIIFFNATKRLKDPALSVIYFSDPLPKARLRLANYYWHFLGGLWLYLLIFFAIVK
ncbi:MAG: cytochrome c oxidase subunit 3 [Chitinophagales bacterium]